MMVIYAWQEPYEEFVNLVDDLQEPLLLNVNFANIKPSHSYTIEVLRYVKQSPTYNFASNKNIGFKVLNSFSLNNLSIDSFNKKLYTPKKRVELIDKNKNSFVLSFKGSDQKIVSVKYEDLTSDQEVAGFALMCDMSVTAINAVYGDKEAFLETLKKPYGRNQVFIGLSPEEQSNKPVNIEVITNISQLEKYGVQR